MICQDNQQARAELERAGELSVDLEDAVKEQHEDWGNKILSFSNVGTIPDNHWLLTSFSKISVAYLVTWSRRDGLSGSIRAQPKPQNHAEFLHQGQE